MIGQNRQHPALARGELEFVRPDNPKVLAFVRSTEDEKVLVVANLSRFPQHTEIDLSRFAGATPVEVFGRSSSRSSPATGPGRSPSARTPFTGSCLEPPATAARSLPSLRAQSAWTEVLADTRGWRACSRPTPPSGAGSAARRGASSRRRCSTSSSSPTGGQLADGGLRDRVHRGDARDLPGSAGVRLGRAGGRARADRCRTR
jgi:maltose alpha-D-glucosyltransferase/alpha-amylase